MSEWFPIWRLPGASWRLNKHIFPQGSAEARALRSVPVSANGIAAPEMGDKPLAAEGCVWL
jgi:hypothetical protein